MNRTLFTALLCTLAACFLQPKEARAQAKNISTTVLFQGTKISEVMVHGGQFFFYINDADVKTTNATAKSQCYDSTKKAYVFYYPVSSLTGTHTSVLLAAFLNKKTIFIRQYVRDSKVTWQGCIAQSFSTQ